MKYLAKIVSFCSRERYKVGAIYVQGWRLSWGWNTNSSYGSHAEDEALERFSRFYPGVNISHGTMYCSWSPCKNCTKVLDLLNITSVYLTEYKGKL
jgi:hypothetical protein